MGKINYIHRETKEQHEEKVYGEKFLNLLYGGSHLARILLPLFCKFPFFSKLYGKLQKSPRSKKKIRPFIQTFKVDPAEFQESVTSFTSFNDFFIRKLKPSARPIAPGKDIAVMPADGRYQTFANFDKEKEFHVKGKKFTLEKLVGDATLAKKYQEGGIMMVRLAPVDYHRFHFPTDCVAREPKLINGLLYSVNPIALKTNFEIFTENKRMITPLETLEFGTILCLEIGATNVGSICQTFTPNTPQLKGDEKGYFEFGGSFMILLFEKGRIKFDEDLLEASSKGFEVLGKMGQSLGRAH